MSDPQTQSVNDLLLRLLAVPKDRRKSRLKEICDDPEKRRAVRELLADRQQMRQFLEQMDGAVKTRILMEGQFGTGENATQDGTVEMSTDEITAQFSVSDVIGPYTIRRILGQGGMGVVYLAEQSEPVQRRLALKLIHRNLRDPISAARFEAERQAMARLSHPNIAQIYQAGTTEDGFPYFAMEYVKGGLPIHEYCDKHLLTVEERLKLFIAVCRGVEHAHQRGIIHRDLKPSNLLVAQEQGQAIVKVIDFGLAKALDQPLTEATQLTQGIFAGTPEYMSPEALDLNGDISGNTSDADTRGDVYSLGIILYELLCGSRPYVTEGLSLVALVQRLLQQDAPPPSRRLSSAASDSRTVIAARRQVQATTLRRRLAGELDHVVMKAIAHDREERYASVADLTADIERHLRQEPIQAHPPSRTYRIKKFVRRHRTAALSSALVLVALILGTVGTTLGMLKANREAETARQALNEAEELASFMQDLFRSSEPGNPAQDMTARQILDVGAQSIREGFESQPEAKARILTTIGEIYIHLALYDQADALLTESLELRRNHPHAVEDVAVLTGLAVLRQRQDRFEEAEDYWREALEALEADDDEPAEVARVLDGLASTARSQNDDVRAEALVRQALEIQQQLDPESLAVNSSLNSLADIHQSQDRIAEAEILLLKALAIAEKASAEKASAGGRGRLALIRTLRNLSSVYRDQGRSEEALATLKRAFEAARQTYGENHPIFAQIISELALHFHESDGMEKAETYYRRSEAIFEKVYGGDSKDLAVLLNNFGAFYWEQERYDEAEPLYLRSLRINEKIFEPGHNSITHSVNNLGLIYWKRGQFEKAEASLSQALKNWEGQFGPDHRLVAWPLWGLAGVYRDQQRFAEAEPFYQRALEIRERILPANNADLRKTRTDYAALLRATGRDAEAEALEAKNLT